MDLVLALHSHLPYVLNHGRWPHGSDWISEAAVDTYLPLLEVLNTLADQEIAFPLTLGITPILANQLASPEFGRELRAFFTQRRLACDEAIADFDRSGEDDLTPIAEFWRGRLARLERLFDRVDGNLVQALRAHETDGRIEIDDTQKPVDGLIVQSADMLGLCQMLARMTPAERRAAPCIGRERADLVVSGCAILEAIMELWPANRLGVADRGIREGILRGLMAAGGNGDKIRAELRLSKRGEV